MDEAIDDLVSNTSSRLEAVQGVFQEFASVRSFDSDAAGSLHSPVIVVLRHSPPQAYGNTPLMARPLSTMTLDTGSPLVGNPFAQFYLNICGLQPAFLLKHAGEQTTAVKALGPTPLIPEIGIWNTK